jgi:hypothetical protein
MDDDGGGGAYAGTNWTNHGVPLMWAMLAGQQTDAHWRHVAGWRRTAELAGRHVSRLRQYRDRLAEVWPPERSAAARAYLTQLDYLVEHVQSTFDAAAANYTAFSAATGGIGTARRDLEKIYTEYVDNEQRIARYEADLAAYEDKNRVEKLFSTRPSNPVPGSRQEELTWRARSLMYELSGTLIEATAQITTPPTYTPPRGRVETQTMPGGVGTGPLSVSNPPFIPPIVTVATQQPPRLPSAPSAASAPAGWRTGPTLVGAIPPPPPVRRIAPDGIIGGSPQTGPVTTKPSASGVAAFPAPRPLPPGGVIGAPPGVGVAQPAAGSASRRINPPGGVIGQPTGGVIGQAGGRGRTVSTNGAGRTPGPASVLGHAGRSAHASPAGGTVGHRPGSVVAGVHSVPAPSRVGHPQARKEPERRWDPDNPWETEEGVPPVVLPPAEPRRHDPGPAIGSGR